MLVKNDMLNWNLIVSIWLMFYNTLFNLILLLLFRFITFAQAVLNAKIFLMGEPQLVAKGQEDAFTLHI